MNYYEISLLKSPLEPLTYQSNQEISIGQKIEVQLQRRVKLVTGVVVKKVSKPTFKCIDIANITNEYFDDIMLQTAKFISQYYVCSLGEALSLYIPFKDTDIIENNISIQSNIILSDKQTQAFEFCQNHLSSLLFANTGSGKTEIYIKAIEKQLNQNKQAVLLMPEIALTPQMEKRLKKIFNTNVAIWHSKIQKKKKNEIIENLLNGTIKIIAGARSALFLPYKNLGLIVVDEEHDDSYKANNKPRLNVKDISLYMSKKFNIQVILGSATPSLISFSKVPYFRLKETFYKTSKEIIYDNSILGLNDNILKHIEQTLSCNEQIIIFLPTRANFKYQICSSCGKSIQCPFCSVSLSLHKQNAALQCHYCNYTQAIPKNCPYCQSGHIQNFRLGTAEVTTQLQNLFPQHKIQTFDKDSVKTNNTLKKILKDFNDNKIDILVGTQMLSKGHDYHNVTLAVILGIDSILNMTSYKVREKTLSLLIQIAGRSGRNGKGKVIIQTKNQDFFEEFYQKKDYKDFLEDELNIRQDIYPPNVKLAKVIFSHTNPLLAYEQMQIYVKILQNIDEIELIGFKESTIFKIANKYRYEILIRSKNIKKLLSFLHSIDTPLASIDMDCLI